MTRASLLWRTIFSLGLRAPLSFTQFRHRSAPTVSAIGAGSSIFAAISGVVMIVSTFDSAAAEAGFALHVTATGRRQNGEDRSDNCLEHAPIQIGFRHEPAADGHKNLAQELQNRTMFNMLLSIVLLAAKAVRTRRGQK
jgi:hypothetical protein